MATGSTTAGLDVATASVVGTGSGSGAVLCTINLQVNERALRFTALICGEGDEKEAIEGIALMPPEEGFLVSGGTGSFGTVEIDNNVNLRLVSNQSGDWTGWLKVEFADAYAP